MAPHPFNPLTLSSSRSHSRGPPSPTFSDVTNVSAMNFSNDGPRVIVTRTDLKSSLQAYEALLKTSSTYRHALIAMSKATAAFADAMAECSGLKGISYEAGTRLQVSSGLHHLVGNHWHLLAETLDKKFEKPLRTHLDAYKGVVKDRSSTYERSLREKSQMIRDTEKRNLNRKERNLKNFRETLATLQRQVDDLDELKVAHYQDVLDHQEEVWNVVQSKMCLVVRSSMEVFEKFTAKMSDPVIEPMLQSIPDPFDSYGPPPSEDQIFSILPPLSTISMLPSSCPSPGPDTESLPTRSNSWAGDSIYPSQSSDDLESPTTPTTPRSFSPPSMLSHRHSSPAMRVDNGEKAGMLRPSSIMPMINEDRPQESSTSHINSSSGATIKAPRPERAPSIADFTWTPPYSSNHSYENFHHSDNTSQSSSTLYSQTPKHSLSTVTLTHPPEKDDTVIPIPVTG